MRQLKINLSRLVGFRAILLSNAELSQDEAGNFLNCDYANVYLLR